MSKLHYINTQEIRRDLMGFLRDLADGQEYVVLNRSKPVVTVSGKSDAIGTHDAKHNMQQFLAAAKTARESAKTGPDPNKSYKEIYAEDMAKKYGLPRHEYPD